jgi:hypothetical protein
VLGLQDLIIIFSIVIGLTDVSTKIDELLGLNFKYSYRHSRVYDNNQDAGGQADRLISEKLDTYTSDTGVQLHDGSTDILAKYEITYTYPVGSTEDKVETMLFTRIS